MTELSALHDASGQLLVLIRFRRSVICVILLDRKIFWRNICTKTTCVKKVKNWALKVEYDFIDQLLLQTK